MASRRTHISLPDHVFGSVNTYCKKYKIPLSQLIHTLLVNHLITTDLTFDKKKHRVDFRDAVLDRDHHRCRICGTRHNLTVHHIIPKSKRSDLRFVTSNGITLCSRCHQAFHEGRYQAYKS